MAADQQDLYAVVRLDSFRSWTPRPENVTVRKLVERLAEAEHEVRQLNATAPTGTVYFMQRATLTREARPAVAARKAAPIADAPASPRTRKARAETKAAKTHKKRR